MKPQRHRIACAAITAALLMAGCSSLGAHWPFRSQGEPARQAVTELAVELPAEGAPPVVLQYWERNTLVVDLTNVTGTGGVTLRPDAERGWPVRIAFRMLPRRFEVLEVRGTGRVLLPVASGSTVPVTADVPAGVHAADTPALRVSWGAAAGY